MDLTVIATEIDTSEFPIVSDHPIACIVRRVVLLRLASECGIAFWDGECRLARTRALVQRRELN
jgi:hypothetical protein